MRWLFEIPLVQYFPSWQWRRQIKLICRIDKRGFVGHRSRIYPTPSVIISILPRPQAFSRNPEIGESNQIHLSFCQFLFSIQKWQMYLNRMNGNHDYIQMQRIQSKHVDLWKSYPVQNSDSKSRDERGANLNARNQLLSQSLPCLGLLWNATPSQLSLITDILEYFAV